MAKDLQGVAIGSGSAESADAFDVALRQYLTWTGDPVATLSEAVARDPGFALGHSAIGTLLALGGTPLDDEALRRHLAEARRASARSARERGHIAALDAWLRGDYRGAIAAWEEVLLDEPRDALALRFAHDAYFYLGDAAGLRDSPARVLPLYGRDDWARFYVRGMHAFGLEESGDWTAAEAAGREAVAANPDDTWAIHAVAHVLEMDGRPLEGIDWLGSFERYWAPASGLAVHQWWHLALYLIEVGREREALGLYDGPIRSGKSPALLDLVDASALLWRLKLVGVELGDRWAELAQAWLAHVGEHVLVFNDAHLVMAAAAAGDADGVKRAISSLWTFSETGSGLNRAITKEVGFAAVDALRAFAAGDHKVTIDLLLPVRHDLYRIGGSNAQRDLWAQTHIAAAFAAGNINLARALTAERVALKPKSARAWLQHAEALSAWGDEASSEAARSTARDIRSVRRAAE